MKYMGSKRYMLGNGLGELIRQQIPHFDRVVDLFCGAASISWFVAENADRPVLAVDLQEYAIVMARAVIQRTQALNSDTLTNKWLHKVEKAQATSKLWQRACALQQTNSNIDKLVKEARELCGEPSKLGPVWNAYGGHYFSPTQALTLDLMLKNLPLEEPERSACLAAIIATAGQCAASPGHTAQPFQPTKTAGPYLLQAWERDPLPTCSRNLDDICSRFAIVKGEAVVAKAVDIATSLRKSDLVIIDPPYSAVHYSRFYHVLETIARGYCGEVSGIGRYPPIEQRPQSSFSLAGESKPALQNLLSVLANIGTTIIFTFPVGDCSNGLSGEIVLSIACEYFDVKVKSVSGRFSTLGGNNTGRASRKSSEELIILMRPHQYGIADRP